MEHLITYIEKEGVTIVASRPLNNLRVHNKSTNLTTFFTETLPNNYFISQTDIANSLDIAVEDRSFIIFDEDTEIDMTLFEFKPKSQLTFSISEVTIYLYISLDNKLRFMCNQKPASRIFYLSNAVNNVSTSDELITFDLSLNTKYLPVKSIDLHVTNRENKKNILLKNFQPVSSIDEGNNIYKNDFDLSFSPGRFFPDLITNFDPMSYDTNIFDLRVSLHFDEFAVTSYSFRISYQDIFKTESVLSYKNGSLLIIYWYPTTHFNNLSYRISIIPKNAYSAYLNQKQNPTPVGQYTKKKNILFIEYPEKAQDNAFILFEYIYRHYRKKFEPYYLISENSKDIDNVRRYSKNVIYYKSKEHMDIFLKTDIICHSHSSNYSLPFLSNSIFEQKKNIKKVFLQHGMMGVRDLEYLYGKKSNPSFTDLFLVSSEREREIVIQQMGYDNSEVKITGLSRFDTLLRNNNPFKSFQLRKKILIMPSWRFNQNELSDCEFKQTLFYKEFQNLINSTLLKQLYEEHKISINLYLHANFQKYRHLFISDFVTVLPEGSQSVQNLLKSHGILITDFSSVGLDFSLLKRPVLYYHFDGIPEENKEDSANYNQLLPGPIFTDQESLLIYLNQKIKKNSMDKIYKNKVKQQLYSHHFNLARYRIVKLLKRL